MKTKAWKHIYGIIGAALLVLAAQCPLEIYASSNTVASGEDDSDGGAESVQEGFSTEQVGESNEFSSDGVTEEEGIQEPIQPEGFSGESEAPGEESVSGGNIVGSASIVGGSYVELEEEIRYEGTVVESIERSGGTYVAGTICSTEPVTYKIDFYGEVKENSFVRYKAGDLEETASIVDNMAEVTFSKGGGEQIQIWYIDGEVENLFLETYLVIEQQAPEISYKRVEKEDGKQYVCVTVTDFGENQSGIKECRFAVDGVAYTPEEVTVSGTRIMPGGKEVPVQQEVDIPLEGQETHEIQVDISDNAGNPASETFSVKALPEGVISVILPTSFRIAIRPYETEENTQIYSDDVVICNKSNFPVDVEVSSVEVEINHAMPGGEIVTKRVETGAGEGGNMVDLAEGMEAPVKDCAVNFRLRQLGKEPVLFPLEEGINEVVAYFSLGAGQKETDLQEVMGRMYAEDIRSSDYAIINICGNLEKGSEDMWRNGDLVVRLIFDFHKQEAMEETEGQ